MLVAWLNATADSPATRRAYRRQVVTALAGMGVRDLGDLSGALLTTWRALALARTEEGAPGRWSDASLRQHLSALRSFLRFARAARASPVPLEDVELALRLPRGRAEPGAYRSLSEPELAALLAAAPSPRDRALLGLLGALGLRRAEVAALDVRDLSWGPKGPVAAVHGKGRRERLVPLYRAPGEPTEVWAALARYLESEGRSLDSPGPLFPGAQGRRLSPGVIRDQVVVPAARRAGLSGLTTHGLRHTAAERMLEASGDLDAVQRLLGHSSPVTTQRYLRRARLDAVARAVPPLPEVE